MTGGTASSAGLRLVGSHDLDGRGDGMQLIRHRDALYVGHHGPSGAGTSILDVSDATRPRLVRQWTAPPGTHTHKVQVGDGLLLVNHERFPRRSTHTEFSAGLAVYDLADPFVPTQVGFWDSGGAGVHRVVYTGGRYAYLSATPEGFNDRIWMIVDLSDPAHPVETARWWWPGQHVAAGEPPGWPEGRRFAAHHALLDGSLAYLGYDDANLVVLDVSDPSRPAQRANLRWDGGSTHTCLPLPGRDLLVVTDEQTRSGPEAPERGIRIVEVSDPDAPRVLSLLPAPSGGFRNTPLRFGAHNLHENQPGAYRSVRLIFATYFSAGLRVYDVADPADPVEVGHWVPDPAPGQPCAQSNDVYVDADGLVYLSDRVGGGVAVLQAEGRLADLIAEAALPAG